MKEQRTALVARFDKNGDHWLNNDERKAARAFLSQQGGNRGPEGRGGRRRGFGPPQETQTPAREGLRITPSEVKPIADAPLYASNVLRTLFLEFENADWEKELEAFHGTDVDVPAKLTVDGKTYPDVGVHFRGASSYMMVGSGQKRSLNLSLDFVHEHQNLGGYHTLNLLNSHEDPTFLRTVLAHTIARDYIPAPKANLVRLVINGENWGVYVNAEQFNKDFVKEWYGTKKGARWKVPGSPMGQGSLGYLGENVDSYKRIYEIKSKDETNAWTDLIKLCRVLKETPAGRLEEALAPLLDIDGALRFLALENALINNDGYWVRTSDYDLYEDEHGKFHLIPYDANETFSMAGGPPPGGGRGRFGGGSTASGVNLDPLVAANDANKPLVSKLLAVPTLRERYLGYVRDIAQRWLDWKTLGPLVEQYASLIAPEVKADTRKLGSFEEFETGVSSQSAASSGSRMGREISLRAFADQRRAYLLNGAATTKNAR